MKWNRHRGGEISGLAGMSFLDVICCGFGAMVLLVLLSRVGEVGGAEDTGAVAALLTNLSGEQSRRTAAERARQRLAEQTRRLEAEIKQAAASVPDSATLQQRLDALRAKANQLRAQAAAQSESKPSASTDDEVKVGGIPVDSDHIIFIVDNSSSMKQIWPRVIAELENVLDIHPQVKGFQIMNGKGVYLISGYAGRWIPDTPGRRKAVLSRMRTWGGADPSNPTEGLRRALRTYAKRTEKLAIYIFGDDYQGGSYDEVLDTVAELNRDSKTGQPRARINGIGFQHKNESRYISEEVRRCLLKKFSTLMREVARQNRGAFIAIGFEEHKAIPEISEPDCK
ncbi:MAG: hypothetical protein OXU71_01085 [Gammaproteobacteria bacterium]|nr:hypothetical protein [Gammaproteobacteria bacterium]